MRKKNTELFYLITALTPSEKRYFKLHANKYITGTYKSSYEKLFDAYSKETGKDFSEEDFKRKNKGKSFIKNLSFEKHYLNELILKVMRNYHSESNPEMHVREMVIDLAFLTDRGLVSQAETLMERAEQMAQHHELFTELLTLNHLRYRFQSKGFASYYLSAEAHAKKETELLQKLTVTRNAIHIYLRLFEIAETQKWQQHKSEIETLMGQARQLASQNVTANRARLAIFNIETIYLFNERRFKECLDKVLAFIHEIDNSPALHFLKSYSYNNMVANGLAAAMLQENFAVFPQLLSKLSVAENSGRREKFDLFREKCKYELIYIMNAAAFQQCASAEQYAMQGLDQFSDLLSTGEKITICYNLALLNFLQKKWKKCIDHLNRLFAYAGNDKGKIRLLILSRFMEIMCHHNIQNTDITGSMLRNLRRLIKLYAENHSFLKKSADILEDQISAEKNKQDKELYSKQAEPHQWTELKQMMLFWFAPAGR